jgi:NAD(P)-dependent dehydrogenase (short-subunit alcohol dehydrogenase family)
MNLVESLWNRAKIGTKIWLGPITLRLRFSRSVSVSKNSSRPRVQLCLSDSSLATDQVPLSRIGAEMPITHIDGSSACAPQRSEVALIVGTGPGLGSALARRFAKAGMAVALAARNTKKLDGLLQEIHDLGGVSRAFGCDATDEQSVKELLGLMTQEMGVPNLVVYNVEHFIPGTILEIETPAFEECWRAMTLGGFLVGREAARLMVPQGSGTIIYTGATAALRGRADYINLAVGKFGIRALAQSMARDLGPQGIHVAHVILDGGILSPRSGETAQERKTSMFPEHIAETYYQLHIQHRSVWTQEMDLRPWVEKF